MSDEFIASLTSSEIIRQYLKDLICDTQIPEDVIDYEESLDIVSPSVIDITKIALPAGNYHKVRICPDTLSDQMYVRIKRHNELKEAYYNIYLPKHAAVEKKYFDDIEELTGKREELAEEWCAEELNNLKNKYPDETSKVYQDGLTELVKKYAPDYPLQSEQINERHSAALEKAAAEFHAIANKPLDYTYLPYVFYPDPVKTYDTDTSFQHHTEWDFLLSNLHNPSVLLSYEWKYINKAVVKNYISRYRRSL